MASYAFLEHVSNALIHLHQIIVVEDLFAAQRRLLARLANVSQDNVAMVPIVLYLRNFNVMLPILV